MSSILYVLKHSVKCPRIAHTVVLIQSLQSRRILKGPQCEWERNFFNQNAFQATEESVLCGKCRQKLYKKKKAECAFITANNPNENVPPENIENSPIVVPEN